GDDHRNGYRCEWRGGCGRHGHREVRGPRNHLSGGDQRSRFVSHLPTADRELRAAYRKARISNYGVSGLHVGAEPDWTYRRRIEGRPGHRDRGSERRGARPDNGNDTAGYGGRPLINGNREQAHSFLLDGMDTNQVSDNLLGYTPAPDAIQEFNLITSNAPAEFGNFEGGLVNVTIKSGTNQYHGD